MSSLYLKYYMGYVQVVNDSMKFLQTCFTLKDSHHAKLILIYGYDAMQQ